DNLGAADAVDVVYPDRVYAILRLEVPGDLALVDAEVGSRLGADIERGLSLGFRLGQTQRIGVLVIGQREHPSLFTALRRNPLLQPGAVAVGTFGCRWLRRGQQCLQRAAQSGAVGK